MHDDQLMHMQFITLCWATPSVHVIDISNPFPPWNLLR